MASVDRGPLSVDKNNQSASGGEAPSPCVITVIGDILSETALLENTREKLRNNLL